MKTILKSIVVVAITISFVACGEAQTTAEGLPVDVTVQQLNEVVNNTPENTIIIDVRTPGEVAEGTVDGAAVIDYNGDEFEAKIFQLDKTATYYVYCKSGGRSSSAEDYMQEQGFTSVHNVLGGYSSYESEGFTK